MHYYVPSKCGRLPEHLQEAFFDICKSGISRATKILQAAANHKNHKGSKIAVDGRIGNQTLSCAKFGK